jgi:hypothetical protein
MVGVTFGTKHSYNDFGLILSSKEIGLPEPKTESVSVIGRDGDIDLTDALGDMVTFENRKITLTFSVLNAHIYWVSVLSTVANYLHGKKMQVILDDDKNFYYYGRCKINQFKSNKTLATLIIECDVEPYKIDVNSAGVPWLWDIFSFVNGIIYISEVTVDNSTTVNLINRAKVVSPTFTCSAAMKATFKDVVYNLPEGKSKVYDIRLQEGDNYITFSGKGTVQINYKGGSL